MNVYTFYDSRAVDRYYDFKLFLKLEDAEAMKNSMGSEEEFYLIDEVKVIE